MKFILLALLTCLTNTAFAIHPDQAIELDNAPRILGLLPSDLVPPLPVEPALPSNFVAVNSTSCTDWTYWGPKDAVESYLKDRSTLQSAIIAMKLSNTFQSTSGTLDREIRDACRDLKALGRPYKSNKTHWGEYPVHILETSLPEMTLHNVFVGLNDQSGAILMFVLLHPKPHSAPSKNDIALWHQFIRNTKPLEAPALFRAVGQDLQPGYTVVKTMRAKLKMTAEKRQRDGMVQVVVIREPGVSFECQQISEGHLGSEWNLGAPLLKVDGIITYKIGNSTDVIHQVTSILVDTVQEFSVDIESMKDRGDLLIFNPS
jgi:hypothetical protein